MSHRRPFWAGCKAAARNRRELAGYLVTQGMQRVAHGQARVV